MRRDAPGDEQLIVIPTERLLVARLSQGFDPTPDPILAAFFEPNATRVMPRQAAEADPRFKQIVCYVVVRCGERVFHYRRSGRVGERRLAGLRSLGVGGHLNASDTRATGPRSVVGPEGLDRAIRRELAEEVWLDEAPPIRYLGIINDDSTDVGRVHVGLVALADLATPRLSLRDQTLTDGRFDCPRDLLARSSEFEGWSQLCLPALINLRDIS